MSSLCQPVTGTATGRRDKVQPVGDRPVPFSCGCAAMNRYRAGTWPRIHNSCIQYACVGQGELLGQRTHSKCRSAATSPTGWASRKP